MENTHRKTFSYHSIDIGIEQQQNNEWKILNVQSKFLFFSLFLVTFLSVVLILVNWVFANLKEHILRPSLSNLNRFDKMNNSSWIAEIVSNKDFSPTNSILFVLFKQMNLIAVNSQSYSLNKFNLEIKQKPVSVHFSDNGESINFKWIKTK